MMDIQKIGEQIEKVRIMGRQIGRVLTDEEMNAVSGGMMALRTATFEEWTNTFDDDGGK